MAQIKLWGAPGDAGAGEWVVSAEAWQKMKKPGPVPLTLRADPVDEDQARQWFGQGAARILVGRRALEDPGYVHDLVVKFGRDRFGVWLPIRQEEDRLVVPMPKGAPQDAITWIRHGESRWGNTLWLEPGKDSDPQRMLPLLERAAGQVKTGLVLMCPLHWDLTRVADSGLAGVYAPGRKLPGQQNAAKTFDERLIKWDERGLVPVIAQDRLTGRVLMLAYMNREALARTLEIGQMVYYSRSRKELWHKGATSGHFQQLRGLWYDCDGDTLLAKVDQVGAACHTGSFSCFTGEITDDQGADFSAFTKEMQGILDRAAHPRAGSYTNLLLDKGTDKICKKVAEEACEVVLAAKNGNAKELAYESCDLLYHLFVLLVDQGLTLESIYQELEDRRKKA